MSYASAALTTGSLPFLLKSNHQCHWQFSALYIFIGLGIINLTIPATFIHQQKVFPVERGTVQRPLPFVTESLKDLLTLTVGLIVLRGKYYDGSARWKPGFIRRCCMTTSCFSVTSSFVRTSKQQQLVETYTLSQICWLLHACSDYDVRLRVCDSRRYRARHRPSRSSSELPASARRSISRGLFVEVDGGTLQTNIGSLAGCQLVHRNMALSAY